MKKLYLLFAALMSVLSFGAYAQTSTEDIPLTVCINIDDPSLCYLKNSNYERVDLQAGENIINLTLHKTTYSDGSTYAYSDTYYLYVEDSKQADYRITACDVEIAGTKSPYSNFYSSTTSMSIYFNSESMNGCTLYPTISCLADLRTATATVTVDDATNVQIRCGNNGYVPTLNTGSNTIYFDPANEANWTIGAKNYGTYLGGVKQNGTAVNANYGSYYLSVKQDDVIDITAQASTDPVTVNFSFTNDGTEAAVTGVAKYINYSSQPVANWKDGFEVDPRTQIIVSLDMTNYKINSLLLNGVSQSVYSSDVYLTIADNSTVTIDAVKYSTFDVTLSLTDPKHVTVSVAESQYSGSTTLTDLEAGEHVLAISGKMTYMIINKVDGYKIDKVAYVKDDAETEVEAGYSGYYVPLTGTSKVIVESHEIVRNQKATLWVNNVDNYYTMYMQRSDNSYIFNSSYSPNPVAVNGDNEFFFDAESDNPISLYFSPKDYDHPGFVMVNDDMVNPVYDGSTNYTFTLKDGDVVKLYAGADTPTSVKELGEECQSGAVYSIFGVKVANPEALAPGIYVINGKKVTVK